MEVGKLIINVVKQKAHITVSVKPFGCMPSSGVSDGVQSLITSKFPGSIFCAVETSGDGATNFYSRVQMYMFKARIAADEELQRTYKELGLTEPQVRDFLAKNPRFASPLHKPPHVIAGTAADLLHEVAPYLTQTRAQRVTKRAQSVAGAVMGVVKAAPVAAAKAASAVRDPEFKERVKADVALLKDLATGKVEERFGPLARRLMDRAFTDRDPVTGSRVVTAVA